MPASERDRVAAVRALARLHRLIDTVESGLTLGQYRVLSAIDQGGVRSAHLARRLAVRGPTLTAIADGLVAAGYATREGEPGDRRVVRLHVTASGRRALREADAQYVSKIGPILDAAGTGLVAELVALGDVLDERLKAKMPTKEITA